MDVKCFYSLYVVCFTVLSVNGDGGGDSGGDSSASAERGTAASYEVGNAANHGNERTLLYDDDTGEDENDTAALKTSRVGSSGIVGGGGSVAVAGRAAGQQPAKRFIVPISPADLGIEPPISRPYFVHSKPLRNQHRQQQQQQRSPQYSSGPFYHQGGRGPPPTPDNYGFGPSSSGGGGAGGHSGYNEQSENYYQSGSSGGGGGENVNFDTTGFTDFASPPTSSAFRGGPSSSTSSAPFTASPFDDGSSAQLSFDPTSFGHDSPSAAFGHEPSLGGFDYPSHLAPVIHKSIYVHVAPPDDEPPRKQRVIMPNVPPKKNYQIVFIKAPTSPPPTAPIIPPPPQHTDKTLIYVLHPKPEEMPPIHVPAPPVTQPLKPEVYFIKYKHRDDSSHTAGAGGDYGPGHDEFGGGGGGGDGYTHRRYGRGDKTSPPAQLTLPPLRDSSAESPAQPSAAGSPPPPPPSQSSAEESTTRSFDGSQRTFDGSQRTFDESPAQSSAESQRTFDDSPRSFSGSLRSFDGSSQSFDDESPHSFTESSRSFTESSSRPFADSPYDPPRPPAVTADESPSSASPSAAAEQQQQQLTTTAAGAAVGGLDDVDMTLEQRELSDPEETGGAQPAPTAVADDRDVSDESAVHKLFRGGYSVEYNDDASVDSSNLSESHAALSAPKGKNGH